MLHYHPRLVHLGWPDLSLVFQSFQDPDMVETTGQVQVELIHIVLDRFMIEMPSRKVLKNFVYENLSFLEKLSQKKQSLLG